MEAAEQRVAVEKTKKTGSYGKIRVGKVSNIVHVAKLSGVSRATAARAFSGSGPVSEETRIKVLEAAKMLDYSPNPLASGLAGGRTRTVGILWSVTGAPDGPEITRKIADGLQKQGYMSFVADSNVPGTWAESIENNRKLLAEYTKRGVDGLILQNTAGYLPESKVMELLERFKAVVTVDNSTNDLLCDRVIRNRSNVFRAIGEHFVRSGRKCPAIVMAIAGNNKIKAEAFQAVIQQHGLSIHPQSIIDPWSQTNRNSMSLVWEKLDELFGQSRFPFDAVACSSDETAITTIAWLRKQGLKVPEDVAVTGFNNIDTAQYMEPPLASARRRTDEVANAVVKLFLERLKNHDQPPQQLDIPMQFVWRESAGGKCPAKK